MTTEVSRRRPSSGLLLSLAGGAAIALAFPRPELFFLAWVGLVPLLVQNLNDVFRRALWAASLSFALVLYWLNIVMTTYGGLPWPLAAVVWLLLSLYLGLYWAVPVWLSVRLRKKCGLALFWSFPLFWCSFEFLRGVLLTGFPWAQIGYSQYPWASLRQAADLFGVAGLGFLVTLVNALIAEGLLRRRDGMAWPVRPSVVVVVLLLGVMAYGHIRLLAYDRPVANPVRLALAQGNIDQGQKWNPALLRQTLDVYRDLSSRAGRAGAEMVIWPESAAPFYFNEPGPARELVQQTARKIGTHLLLGAPAYERDTAGFRYFNSAFLLAPDGTELGRSDKIHLVPFGEYVPLKWLFPFVDKLVVGIGDFSPGTVSPLRLNGHSVGVLVCYEAIFPELARRYVAEGASLLVNLTNDAWFGRSSAPWQHLFMAAFRAVENRVWLARAANTGISALISPTGKVAVRSNLFETSLVVGDAGFGAGASFYRQGGFVFPYLCVFLSLVLWLAGRRKTGLKGR